MFYLLEGIFLVMFVVGLFRGNPVLIICGAGGALVTPLIAPPQ